MTIKERREIQAREEHPTLHKWGQNGFVRALGQLLWTPKAEKKARRYGTPVPRYNAPRMPRAPRAHGTMVVYGNVYFNN
jgi:hypothetical protein